MKNYLIFGASKGLGDAFAKGLPSSGDKVWIVSRTIPDSLNRSDGVQRIWIQADLSSNSVSDHIVATLKNERVDVLIYNVGIWEKDGFEAHYDFEKDDPEYLASMIHVNITSAIVCIQKLLNHLKQSNNGKIILIGSTAGLENTNNSQVAFVTSKFGLRGIGSALREHVRKYEIDVTCINPGELAVEIPFEDGADKAISVYKGTRIPVQDMVEVVKCVVNLSKVSCVKEIHIPAMTDTNA
ncbi:SDR family oxidoreductase [Bacillus sp. DX1.1]|uniref:SDR family NAD(P)-dependent oxidoreductase n=1 Tax=unclassified Bacillus (in: firmicutes) TaxID=185979 RepID=UPI00257119A0|nr:MULTISPECIES: SDR family oxidoreductase [unclassified Bacillus (in: firmicutes)]MDM5154818.1 SDR family oxidoreductase [Bacillus sp. DX1.1]WJE83694.1 SDR family oxidoreductase [Bacillus sp. DX3.1]